MDLSDIVCIVEKNIYNDVENYLISLGITIRFYPCKIVQGEKILVVQTLLDLNYDNASFIGLLNTKQLTIDEWSSKFRDNIACTKLPIHIFDYSNSNIKYMEENFGVSGTHLPYKNRPLEIGSLKKLIVETPKEYDLAIIDDSPYNNKMLKELQSSNIKIQVINNWNSSKEIAKCKVLLNIHLTDQHKIFEEMRCNRWLMAGMTIISENSLYDDDIKLKYNNLITFKTENFKYEILKYFNITIPKLRIGVAIPTYKKDLIWLKRCLNSIEKQILKPDIVSISASSCIISDIPKLDYSFPLKIITTEKQQNAATNRNIAASYLKDVDIISFFDSDDEMLPEKLLFIERSFNETNNDFVLHNFIGLKRYNEHININNTGYKSYTNVIVDNIGDHGVKKPDSIIGHMHRGHMSVSMNVWNHEKYQESNQYLYWEDSEYAKRLVNKNYKGNYIQNELSIYHDYKETFDEFYGLAKQARSDSKHLDCYNYCMETLPLSDSKNEHLIYYELSIIAYYTIHKNKGGFYSDKVIFSPHASSNIINQCIKNSIFYIEKLNIHKKCDVDNNIEVINYEWTNNTKTFLFTNSSSFIPYNDGYLCTVFYVINNEYFHRFVFFNTDYTKIKFSHAVELIDRNKQYLVLTINDNMLEISTINTIYAINMSIVESYIK